MIPKGKILETTQRMRRFSHKKLVFGEGKCNYLYWIIIRYLKYAGEALIHGYPIIITNCKISLAWTEPRHLTKYEKPKYMFSPFVFDHMFFLHIEGKFIDNEKFDFFVDKKMKKRIEEKLSTDAVYQFIKK